MSAVVTNVSPGPRTAPGTQQDPQQTLDRDTLCKRSSSLERVILYPPILQTLSGVPTHDSIALTVEVAEVTGMVPCPLASHNLRWSHSSKKNYREREQVQPQTLEPEGSLCTCAWFSRRLKIYHLAAEELAKKADIPIPVTLSKQLFAGPFPLPLF